MKKVLEIYVSNRKVNRLAIELQVSSSDSQQLTVHGDLTRKDVAKIARDNGALSTLLKAKLIDLSQVGKVDTSGLAWILVIVESAKQRNLELKFSNLPIDLVKLAKLSAVDALIPR